MLMGAADIEQRAVEHLDIAGEFWPCRSCEADDDFAFASGMADGHMLVFLEFGDFARDFHALQEEFEDVVVDGINLLTVVF